MTPLKLSNMFLSSNNMSGPGLFLDHSLIYMNLLYPKYLIQSASEGLVCKPGNQSSVHGTRMVERDNQLLLLTFWPPHMCCGKHVSTHEYTHVNRQPFNPSEPRRIPLARSQPEAATGAKAISFSSHISITIQAFCENDWNGRKTLWVLRYYWFQKFQKRPSVLVTWS